MIINQRQLTGKDLLNEINDNSYWNKKNTLEFIERANKAKTDSERPGRLKENLCKCCYYLRSEVLAGAAITKTNCVVCESEMTFSSTATYKICEECAKKYRLCKRCLSDIDFKERRKL